MNDFNFDTNFNFELDNSKTDLRFIKRGYKGNNVIDFSNIIKCNEAMRFEIVKSVNFKIPDKGENLFIITSKNISLLDVVNFIENEKGKLSDIIIFFFTVNEKGAKYTIELSKRANVNLIISEIMNTKREKERLITRLFDNNNVEIVFCNSHAKIASFKINDNYYTLVGSMNAGSNEKIENLNIINSFEMYSFIEKSFKEIKEKYRGKKRYEV
jgi:hypothetical protein